MLGLAARLDLEIEQHDMKITFLHDDVEEFYTDQPKGFEVKDKENFICKLKKTLYGLKQALRI
jgi:predicted P-loop ATPase